MADFTVFTKFSEGTAFLLHGLTYNDEVVGCNTLKKEGRALRNVGTKCIYIYQFPTVKIVFHRNGQT